MSTSPPDAAPDAAALRRRYAAKARSERISDLFNWELWDYQAAIADDPAADVVVTCGRQVGKTETGGSIAAEALVSSDGWDIMIAAKWQETADEMLRRAKSHLERGGYGETSTAIETWNKTEVETAKGARLYSRTLKVTDGEAGDNQRGKLPRVVLIDESALIDEAVITKVIKPMFLTHGEDHQLYLFSTPRGKQGFHYEKHENDPSWSEHHVPTRASPIIDDEYLESEREDVDDLTWQQEYEGEFIDLGEVYISRDTYDNCLAASDTVLRGDRRYLGVDVARHGSDDTVYLGMDASGTVAILDSEALSDVRGIVSRIGTLHDQHNFAGVGVDENAVGGGVVDYAAYDVEAVMHPIPFTTKNKSRMYAKLKGDLESGDLTVPSPSASEAADRLRSQTVNLQYDFTVNGWLKIGHAPGGKDDFADALAIANWVRDHGGAKRAVARKRSGRDRAQRRRIEQPHRSFDDV